MAAVSCMPLGGALFWLAVLGGALVLRLILPAPAATTIARREGSTAMRKVRPFPGRL
jgi:hypothetical protein